MPCPALLLALLLSPQAAAQGPPLPERVRDDFAADSRAAYEIEGDVAWQKGRLTLGPKASLARTVGLGPTAEVEVGLTFPADEAEARFRLRLGDGVNGPLLVLRRDGEQMTLADRTDKAGPSAAVGKGGQPGWRVRVHFGHGLVRAKAWPDGTAEPAGWPLTRFLSKHDDLQTGVVHLETAGTCTLRLFCVRGAAAAKLSAKQQDVVQRAHRRFQEARRQNELRNTLKARALYKEALGLYRQAFPAGHPWIANSLHNLAMTYDTLGQSSKALALYEEAQALRRQTLPPGHPRLAEGLNNLGIAYNNLGRPEKATATYHEALAIFRGVTPADQPRIAMTLTNLGLAYNALGQAAKAKEAIEEALALHRQVLPKGHPTIAATVNSLGLAYAELGQRDRARVLYEEALALYRKMPAPNPRGLALTLGNLAGVYSELGQSAKARPLFEEALALNRQALPAGHPELVLAQHNLAHVYTHLGQPAKAVELHEAALPALRRALPAGHYLLGRNLNNLGMAYTQLRQFAKAEGALAEALAVYRKALPAGHPEFILPLNNLALLSVLQGKKDEAWRLALEAGATETESRLRILAGSPQRDHLPLLAKSNAAALQLLLAEIVQVPEGRLRDLLAQVAARQALGGLSARLRHEAALVSGDAQAAAMYADLKRSRQQLADLLLRGVPAKDAAGFRERVEGLQREQDRLERELAKRVQGYAPLAEAARADPDALAAGLGAGEAFVTFLVYPRPVPAGGGFRPHYAALLLWRDGDQGTRIHHLPLGEAGAMDEAVRAWRAAVQKGVMPDGPDRVLRDKLWGPLARALPAGLKQLAVVPDGQLALLPLGALRQEDGSYLLERYAIRYLGAARDLLPAPEAKADGPAVVVSDPAYGLPAGGTAKPPAGGPAPGKEFRRLPGFAREAQAATKLLRGRPGWDVRPLSGAAATEEALAGLKRPRLLYLITHGFFLENARPPAPPGLRDLDFGEPGPRARRPVPDPRLRSGLALAGANRGRERSAKGLSDGLLTAAEVENLDLVGTELVIFSACETGLGEIQNGEGVLGLRRAFQLAGAQTVVASLWKVPDDQTETLMTGFLERWLNGAGKAEALRQAQLALIRDLRASADPSLRDAPPLYWAGFVCHGRPD